MTLRLSAFFLTTFLLFTGSALCAEESAPVSFLGLVTGDHVNLRAGPGVSTEVLHQFSRRAKVQVLARQGDWLAVPLPDSIPAFVRRDYLQTDSQGTVRVRGERVHVRAGPGLGSASYGVLSDGELVWPWYERGEWVAIQAPGFCRGWIHRSYVTVLEPVPQS